MHSRLESETAEASRRRLIPARRAGQGSVRYRRARRGRRPRPARGRALAAGGHRCWAAGKVRHVTGSSCQGPRLGRVGGAFCRFELGLCARYPPGRGEGRRCRRIGWRNGHYNAARASHPGAGAIPGGDLAARSALRLPAPARARGGCRSRFMRCEMPARAGRRAAVRTGHRLVRDYIPRVAGVSVEDIRRALRHFIICTPAQQPPM